MDHTFICIKIKYESIKLLIKLCIIKIQSPRIYLILKFQIKASILKFL